MLLGPVKILFESLIFGLCSIKLLPCRNSFCFFQGPENPDDAKKEAPNSLRAKFGDDLIQNAVHCSESPESANRVI